MRTETTGKRKRGRAGANEGVLRILDHMETQDTTDLFAFFYL